MDAAAVRLTKARDLSSLDLLTEYRSIKEDPAAAFYRPCLLNSQSYKRAVGYFRSTVYLVIGPAIVEFAQRGGRIQLICSPSLAPEDIDGIAAGYSRRSRMIEERLISDIDRLLAESGTSYATQVLATLVSAGALEIKLAVRADRKGLYHEKIGVFADCLGNRASFKGSANETWSGWDLQGNFESIEVFCSWRGGLEEQRVKLHECHFDTLWQERDPHVEVFPFPVAAVERLKRASLEGLDAVETYSLERTGSKREPLPHQLSALENWAKSHQRGIFEHATGSGKTFTAMLAIRAHTDSGKPAIVLAPTRLLLEQWACELREDVPRATMMLAGGGYDGWRSPSRLKGMTANDESLGGRVVVATMQTAASDFFLANISEGSHVMLVADEVHQIGSPYNARFLAVDTGPRLGLSATPSRYGDPGGTQRILDYFGNPIPPKITLQDAIRAGRLVDYEYYPHAIHLSQVESQDWKDYTLRIRNELGRTQSDEVGTKILSERAKLLLIQRARIAKKAVAKIDLAREIVGRHYQEGQRWLIYCEDQDQLDNVRLALQTDGYRPLEYHSSMSGDRVATLAWFKTYGGPLVSIRCLDEGVDIPEVSHALILASSQNPRQFIQRRGRVLRKAPGKEIALVYDAIVVPSDLSDEPEQAGLLRSELLRSIEFAKYASNAMAAAKIRSIAVELGIDPDSLIDVGIEEDHLV